MKRNFGLDLIRAIAILLVVISHLGIWPRYVGGLKIGQLGVEIFFVLSGSLIGGILIKNFTRGGVNIPVVFNFWIRRWFRTLPVYYLMLIYKYIFIDDSIGYKVLVYFVFLQNNFVKINFFGVSWSLVIEEWFYLLLPVFSLLLFYKQKFNPHKFLILITGFILFENIIRLFWVLYTNRPYESVNGNFPFRLDSLMWGVLLAFVKINYNEIYFWFSRTRVFIFFAAVFAILLWQTGKLNLVAGKVDELIWTRTVLFTINSALVATLIPFLEVNYTGEGKPNIFKRVITFISLISYSLYLIHPEVYHYFRRSAAFTPGWYTDAVICISLSIAIAAVMYYCFEKPVMNLRERIKIKPKVPADNSQLRP